jgi:hypothetical protein
MGSACQSPSLFALGSTCQESSSTCARTMLVIAQSPPTACHRATCSWFPPYPYHQPRGLVLQPISSTTCHSSEHADQSHCPHRLSQAPTPLLPKRETLGRSHARAHHPRALLHRALPEPLSSCQLAAITPSATAEATPTSCLFVYID